MATDIRQLLPTNVRAALLAGSAPSSINPYVTASALSSFGFVPYTGATANVDLGAFSLTSPTIYGSSLASGTLTLQSTSNATKGKILFGTSAYDEVNNRLGIGTTSPGVALDIIGTGSISNLLTCGQINAYTSNLGLYAKNANSSIFFGTNIGATILAQFSGTQTSGSTVTFNFTPPANTNQSATSNIPNLRISGSNKQWATGTVPLQYFNHLTANTVSAVGASIFTNVYGLYVEAATAGTNATITNNYAAGFSGRVGQYGLGNSTYFGDLCGVKDDIANRQNTAFGAQAANKVASGGLNVAMGYQSLFTNVSGNNNVAIGGLTLYQATSNSNIAVGGYALYNVTTGQSNVALGYDTGGGVTIGSNNVFIGNNITGLPSSLSNNIILATNLGVERFRYNPSQGSASLFSFSPASTTANVASTEINIFRVNAATTSISTGALATQRFTYLRSQTLAFTGASTATNVFGLFVEAATAGANATITNNYSLGTDGKAKFGGNIELTQTVTTEALTSNTSVTIVINGVTYKLLAKA